MSSSSQDDEQLDGERDLRLLPVGLLHLAAHEEVVELVGAAELDVGLHRHRVVRLHDRVQELRHRDRRLLGEALGEVVALEQPGDGRRPRQPDDLRVVELAEPLAVEPDLRPFRVDDRRRLLEVALRVAIDLLAGEHRPLDRAARRIADACRVVADDEHADVSLALEGGHSLQRNAVAEGDVGCRHIDAELHAQRAAECELRLETAFRQHVHGVLRELRKTHRANSTGGTIASLWSRQTVLKGRDAADEGSASFACSRFSSCSVSSAARRSRSVS